MPGSAADLPEQGYNEPTAMARALVTYLDDSSTIRNAILSEFQRAPSHRTIERFRAEYLERRARPDPRPAKPHDGYYPLEASQQAEWNNNTFLTILRREHPERFAEAAA